MCSPLMGLDEAVVAEEGGDRGFATAEFNEDFEGGGTAAEGEDGVAETATGLADGLVVLETGLFKGGKGIGGKYF